MTPQEIQAALETQLAATLPTTPAAWPNVAFDPAIDAVDAEGNKVLWIRPTNKPGTAEIADFQDGKQPGIYIIQIFAPEGEGEGEANATAETIMAAFRRQTISGVECLQPYPNDVGNDANGWYQVNVVIPWFAWTE